MLLLGAVWLASRRPIAPDGRALAMQQAAAEEERRQLEANFEAYNLPPIVFHGLVVDQDTNVVAGATVRAVVVRHLVGRNTEEPLGRLSGLDGRFTIDGVNGTALGVAVSRTNYHPAPGGYFKYSRLEGPLAHQPDPERPVVFVLTEKRAPEILVSFSRWFGITNTGAPTRIDLTTGEIVPEGGDLIVSIECLEKFEFGNPIPWKMRIEVVGGGFVRSEAQRLEHMYEAPAYGYEPTINVSYGHEGEGFGAQFNGLFYLMSRNGQNFGKVRLDMTVAHDERGVPFGIRSVINTNASRVLATEREYLVDLNRLKGWRPQ
jgi:hypothetical protein